MCRQDATLECRQPLSPSQIADLRLAASKMSGPNRRAFEAEMTLKYCEGNPLMAEAVFGWGRQTVALGLAESRSGIICLGAQAAFSGRKRWEEQQPQAAQALCQLADAHAQQDPTFRTSLTYTRLTAQAALQALGFTGSNKVEALIRTHGRRSSKDSSIIAPIGEVWIRHCAAWCTFTDDD